VEQANKREHHLSNFGLDRVSLWGRGFTLWLLEQFLYFLEQAAQNRILGQILETEQFLSYGAG
jgi:hypothetical protein